MSRPAMSRYPALTIFMHWLMLVLLIAVYACIELRVIYPNGSVPREALKTWHFMLGLSIFALVCVRVILRSFSSTPAIVPVPPRWQLYAARMLHALLYLFMVAMPLAGWALLSAAGKPIPFFGFELTPLIGENKELAKQIKAIHVQVGEIGYYLIGIHALAGLFHHYIVRDNTLLRILPRNK